LSLTDTLQNIPDGGYSVQITTATCDTLLYLAIPRENSRVSFEADTLACSIDTVRFQNTSDPYFTDFVWAFGDYTFSELQDPIHTYGFAGRYTVQLIGTGSKCSDTAYKHITVDSLFPAFFQSQPVLICTGEAITFTAQQGNPTLLSRSWAFGDHTGIKTTPDDNIQHAYDMAGRKPVRMQAHYRACPDVDFRDTVYVFTAPKVDLGQDTSLCPGDLPLVLKNLAAEPGGSSQYSWNTGETAEQIMVTHPGTYSLTVSNAPLGCTTTEKIEIKKGCYIDIPNAFTPNGDGKNDYFFPRQLLSGNLVAFRMQIWNRWGQVIFETLQTDGRGWDGKFNGKEQPEGVYMYLVEIMPDGSSQKVYKGNVTLLR
jgi:gliding motility-associated-like protein